MVDVPSPTLVAVKLTPPFGSIQQHQTHIPAPLWRPQVKGSDGLGDKCGFHFLSSASYYAHLAEDWRMPLPLKTNCIRFFLLETPLVPEVGCSVGPKGMSKTANQALEESRIWTVRFCHQVLKCWKDILQRSKQTTNENSDQRPLDLAPRGGFLSSARA